ncbi:Oidioi.mRNA.OKI2018_I69.XSR.g16075.t1.cds [Oikopleura dioica]|uniref:Oidioi.mRNA.OKI2018_I69.XSR.g16075.t1.cds n=1 Tax=Oikopleura dioica TaxID=34765 RepID=A0ABN7SEX2_OIKDI|nr:Oidioi.mRNA.OKI2018_I69.XSR.g16075.t1.cds [Oikopleura dioica]
MPKRRAEEETTQSLDLTSGDGPSTLQMIRPFKKETATEFLYQKPPISVFSSRRFSKRLLLIGISEICRKRLGVPKDEFILKIAGDVKVQVLNPYDLSGSSEAIFLKKLIQKIFMMAENGWLSKVIMKIGTDDGKQLELYAFSLKERPICNEMDEHAVVDLTQDENAQLRTEVEDLIQALHKKLPTTPLGDVKFSCQVAVNHLAPKKIDLEGFNTADAATMERPRVLFKRHCKTKFHEIDGVGVQALESDEEYEVESAFGW